MTDTEKLLAPSQLGKTSEYTDQYNPELLFSLPRQLKRDEIQVATPLPFHGYDLWHAWEVSWLNPKGKPMVAVARIHIDCTSPNLIESKSLKLYLNSYNQTHFDSSEHVQKILSQDLSQHCGHDVTLTLQPVTASSSLALQITHPPGCCLDTLDISVNQYHPNPKALIAASDGPIISETVHSNLLKSNCLITGQPDWGSVVIHYSGPKINHEGLLSYIISFRHHNEFHEQCVERIFMDLLKHCHCRTLTVAAYYTRRGGLDINPYRSNDNIAPFTPSRLIRQ